MGHLYHSGDEMLQFVIYMMKKKYIFVYWFYKKYLLILIMTEIDKFIFQIVKQIQIELSKNEAKKKKNLKINNE
jgi:hypothetical protein